MDLVLSDSLTLSDSLQVGRGNRVSDQITLSDSVVVELGPTLVSQVPVEVLTGSSGLVRDTQLPTELLVPTNGLIQLILSDTITFSDSLRIGRGLVIAETLTMTDSASAVLSAPQTLTLSDNLNNWTDAFASRLAVQILLVLSDSMTTLTDSVATLLDVPRRRLTQEPVEILTTNGSRVRLTQGPIEILTPAGDLQLVLSDSLNNWLDAFQKSLSNTQVYQDTLVLSDSSKIGYGNVITDTSTMTDSIIIAIPINLSFTDSLNNWLDSFTATSAVTLTESLSDSLNFWTDSLIEVMTVAPRGVPSGDPSDNCCPPNIFITD